LEIRTENAQAMPCRHEEKGQREQAGLIARAQRGGTASPNAGKNLLKDRQVLCLDEAVPLENLLSRIDVAEQLHHGLGNLAARSDQLISQSDLVQNLTDMRVLGEILDVEHWAHRCAEQQVLRERGVLVEPVD